MNFEVDLVRGKIVKPLLIFALPILVSSLFQQLYNTVDTIIVGNVLGITSLAAMGACSEVYGLLIGFATGVGSGMSIVSARNYGSGDMETLKKSVAGMITISIGITVLLMMIAHFGLYPLLQLLNTPVEIIGEAYSYISVITVYIGVTIAYNTCAGMLRTVGDSFMALVFLIIASVLNVVLDLFFIIVLKTGIVGTAWATVIAQGVAAVLCFIYIAKEKNYLVPKKEHFKYDAGLYQELIAQGLSVGFITAFISIGNVVLQRSINGLGYLVIAAHTAARKINFFIMLPCTSIAGALAVFVPQNRGLDQKDRIRKGVKAGIICSFAWGITAAILMIFFAEPLTVLLSGSTDSSVIANCRNYMIINAPFYGVFGTMFIFRYTLQGVGQKAMPLVSSLIEFAGKIIFVTIFIPQLGYWGVIICEPIIWSMMCLQLMGSYFRDPYMKRREPA